MGAGNCMVKDLEGLFYVDWNDLHIYTNTQDPDDAITGKDIPQDKQAEYSYDADLSQANFEAFKDRFCTAMAKHFKSLQTVDYWKGRKRHVIMDNKLFLIAFEDNDWSLAVEVLLKDGARKGLQKQMTKSFIKGTKKILLKEFGTIYIRTGSWTSEPITE